MENPEEKPQIFKAKIIFSSIFGIILFLLIAFFPKKENKEVIKENNDNDIEDLRKELLKEKNQYYQKNADLKSKELEMEKEKHEREKRGTVKNSTRSKKQDDRDAAAAKKEERTPPKKSNESIDDSVNDDATTE